MGVNINEVSCHFESKVAEFQKILHSSKCNQIKIKSTVYILCCPCCVNPKIVQKLLNQTLQYNFILGQSKCRRSNSKSRINAQHENL